MATGIHDAGALLYRALNSAAGHDDAACHLAFIRRVAIAVKVNGANLRGARDVGRREREACEAEQKEGLPAHWEAAVQALSLIHI